MSITFGFSFFEIAILGVVASSFGYLCFALIMCLGWRKPQSTAPAARPAVTVFKPVRGATDRLYDNLKSFCEQDYPDFEIIFGVASDDDPALPVIMRLIEEHPDLQLMVSIGNRDAARNPKIATVLPMESLATNDLWVLADSDVRVQPEFLKTVAESFADETVGGGHLPLYRCFPAQYRFPFGCHGD